MNSGNDANINSNRWRPFVLSLSTHLALVVILILLVQQSPTASEGEQEGRRVNVVLSTTDRDEIKYLTETDVQPELAEQAAASSASAAASQAPQTSIPERNHLPGAVMPDSPDVTDASQMVTVPENSRGKHEYELSEDDLKMIAEDQRQIRNETPIGEEATLSLFGTGGLSGRKFVFVLDRSKSMGTGGLGVLRRAETELKAAVDQLESNHSFQVVAYHHHTITINSRELLPATSSNKDLVPQFVHTLAASGSTSHDAGLISALVFRPDVVVFMTDGGLPELHAGQLDTIRRMAHGAEIHCIQFGRGPLQNSDNFMTTLAAENNGSYRYIDVNHWDP